MNHFNGLKVKTHNAVILVIWFLVKLWDGIRNLLHEVMHTGVVLGKYQLHQILHYQKTLVYFMIFIYTTCINQILVMPCNSKPKVKQRNRGLSHKDV